MSGSSSSTVVLVLVAAAAISILGAFFAFDGPLRLAGAFSSTGQGNVSANVGSQASLVLRAQLINFSTVQAGDSKDSANCGTDAVTGSCFFSLENDGTVPINVTANVTGSIWQGTARQDDDYQIYGENNESSSAVLSANSSYKKNMTISSGAVGAAPLVFSFFNYTNSKDLVNVRIAVSVPVDEGAGVKTSTVTFTGTAS